MSAPLGQPADVALTPGKAVASNQNDACPWLRADQVSFLPEFGPLEIKQWGPRAKDQMLSTPEKMPGADEASVLTPGFQKLAANMTRGKVASPQMATQSTPCVQANGQQSLNVDQPPAGIRLQHDKKSGNWLIDGGEMKPLIISIPTAQNPGKMRACCCHLDPPRIKHRPITRGGTVSSLHDHGAKSDETFVRGAPVHRGNLAANIWHGAFHSPNLQPQKESMHTLISASKKITHHQSEGSPPGKMNTSCDVTHPADMLPTSQCGADKSAERCHPAKHFLWAPAIHKSTSLEVMLVDTVARHCWP